MTHSSALREPWDKLTDQREAASFGIWIFLASEILFFAAFFLAYAFLRTLHPEAFALGSKHTEVVLGTINTVLLLTSSLTMVLASRAADIEAKPAALGGMAVTILLGLAFLVVKAFEYKGDIEDGLVPGAHFALEPAAQLFWSFYWIATMVHVIHLTIGLVAIGRLTLAIGHDRLPMRSPQIEITALYWCLVDIVWIILFPLLYLGGRG